MNTCGTKGGLSQRPDREITTDTWQNRIRGNTRVTSGCLFQNKLYACASARCFRFRFFLPVFLRIIRPNMFVYNVTRNGVIHFNVKIPLDIWARSLLLRKSNIFSGDPSFFLTNRLDVSVFVRSLLLKEQPSAPISCWLGVTLFICCHFLWMPFMN